MIKHTEAQLVSFEDCGFAREPEMPVVGQTVRVCCRTEKGDVPVLIAEENRHVTRYRGEQTDENHTCFLLGPYDEPQTVTYRFETKDERTRTYRMEVVTEEQYEQPCRVISEKDGLSVWVAKDLCCRIGNGDELSVRLLQQALEGSENAEQAESSCGKGITVRAEHGCIFSVSKGNELFALTALTVWRDRTGRVVKVRQVFHTHQNHIFGTGERFDAIDQQGRSTNGAVTEKFTHQGDQTYLPVPFFMTEQGWGCFCRSDLPVRMDFETDRIVMTREAEDEKLAEDVFLFGNVPQMLRRYAELTGKPALPPEWAFGVWISGNGWNNDAEVDEQLRMLREHRYPASVMVLEQWSDERTFHIWHKERFPDPASTVKRIRDAGLHLILWQIPVVKYEWDGEPGAELEQETREALAAGYAVQYPDGTPYRITERWFHHSLLPDFTNPETVKWWFAKRKYLLDMGVEGFKTDGGEFLFDQSARLHDGASGRKAHNLYPLQYENAYSDFLRQNGVNGVIFSRAGYAGAQIVPIHWAGDQVSEWSELKAQLNAGISAGLSGVIFWGFDIGGFAGPIPTPELYLRATALGCFSPIMQWHSEPRNGQFSGGRGEAYNNDRSPWNIAEKWQCPKVLELGCRFAEIREKLRPYLWREAQHCAETGRPMMAHLCVDHPDDPFVFGIHDEYILGRELLIAPITEEGQIARRVYLPAGEWTDFFTGKAYPGGQWIERVCGLDEIPVFRRKVDA